jgi:hypothetical protein
MEVTNLKTLGNTNDQLTFITKYFSDKDIDSPEFIDSINTLLQKSRDLLEKRAPLLSNRRSYEKIKKIEIQSRNDIIQFLEGSNNSDRRTSILYCSLLKYMYLLDTYSRNPIYTLLEKIEI